MNGQYSTSRTESKPTTSKKATIAGLIAMGWYEYEPGRVMAPARTSMKYRIFSKANAGRQMMVGKSGGLRVVYTGQPLSSSNSLTGSKTHRAICEIGNGRSRFDSTDQAEETYARIMADPNF